MKPPSEKSKIGALLRAVQKLDSRYDTRIEILEDRVSELDYNSVVASLKETEQRIKVVEDEEKALAANDQLGKQSQRKKGRFTRNSNPKAGSQRKRQGKCWCCRDGGNIKTESSVWLKT